MSMVKHGIAKAKKVLQDDAGSTFSELGVVIALIFTIITFVIHGMLGATISSIYGSSDGSTTGTLSEHLQDVLSAWKKRLGDDG